MRIKKKRIRAMKEPFSISSCADGKQDDRNQYFIREMSGTGGGGGRERDKDMERIISSSGSRKSRKYFSLSFYFLHLHPLPSPSACLRSFTCDQKVFG